jgi:hypothetical protein
MLKPKAWRVVTFFVAFFVAVAGPTVVPWMAILFGPPAYQLSRSALAHAWLGTREVDGVSIEVTEYSTRDAAHQAASEAFDRITTSMSSRGPGIYRYRRSDTQARGLVLWADNVVVRAEGVDAEAVEQGTRRLPFLAPDPRSADRWLAVAFEKHLAALLVGLGIYVAVLTVGMFRGGVWAARIAPPEGVVPIPGEEMRQRLLAINDLDVPVRVRQTRRGHLVAEWRLDDAKWTGMFEKGGLSIAHSVKFKLDEANHAVRAIDFSRRVSWSAGVPRTAFSFSFVRGIVFYEFESARMYGLFFKDGAWQLDDAYRYSYNLNELKQPIVEAVVAGGWIYQPVAFFLPLLG